jgi:hypothetical protein
MKTFREWTEGLNQRLEDIFANLPPVTKDRVNNMLRNDLISKEEVLSIIQNARDYYNLLYRHEYSNRPDAELERSRLLNKMPKDILGTDVRLELWNAVGEIIKASI